MKDRLATRLAMAEKKRKGPTQKHWPPLEIAQSDWCGQTRFVDQKIRMAR
jgi:hypothetical protein